MTPPAQSSTVCHQSAPASDSRALRDFGHSTAKKEGAGLAVAHQPFLVFKWKRHDQPLIFPGDPRHRAGGVRAVSPSHGKFGGGGPGPRPRDGRRFVNTVPEFKGNVKAIETAPLLHPEIVAIKTAGWLNPERDLKKTPITAEEQAMLNRATSNQGYHYFGEGRFFILLGKAFAETMLELQGK